VILLESEFANAINQGSRMYRIILLAAALGLTGCGGSDPPPMAGTPESSRTALVDALDGWKAGKSYQEFTSQPAPLYFVDEDLNRSAKLLDYRIDGEGRPMGTGYSYVVSLTLQEGGKTRTKRVAYTAVTEPKRAVTREDRSP
jgi:hypothetical protein